MKSRVVSTRLERVLASLALGSVFALGHAHANGTERFEVETSAAFLLGTVDGTAVFSSGHVTPGLALRRTPLDAALTAYTSIRGRDGTLYVGTGTDGIIYRMRGETVEVFARTGQLLVASLALDAAGNLYAGTLPEGRVYAIEASGNAREIVRLESAEHVWALAWDRRSSRLIAGTGPDARVYSIDPRANTATLLYDGTDTHVMSVVVADDGSVYAGTSDRALVLHLVGGRAEVVFDAPGNEITALAMHNGALLIAANEFQVVPAQAPPTNARAAPPVGRNRPRPGKGRLFRVECDGRTEKIFEENDGHFTDLEVATDGTVYIGGGKDGRIYRVAPDRSSSVWVDVDERQVLSIGLTTESPYFVTGDGAAIYRVDPHPTAQPTWTSQTFDATQRAQFGQVALRGTANLEWATRTGNVDVPDTTWTDWSRFQRSGAPVASSAGRYLQVRVRFPATGASDLRGLTVFYLGSNQRPVVTAVTVTVDASQATQRRRGRLAPTSIVRLTWRMDNPDSDEVRYRLRVRREGETALREILRSDVVHTATTYDWDTQGLADGLYVVEVEATDELSNSEGRVLHSTAVSDPIVVDNHAPRIDGLAVRGDAIVGRAIDAVGPITRLEVAVDGQPFRDIDADDHLLDSADEAFRVPVASVGAGPHTVAVRATDTTGHTIVAEINVGR